MLLKASKENIIKGGCIFAGGDFIASLILDEFSIIRLLGMLLTGAFIYAFEIPNYFLWIERVSQKKQLLARSLFKVFLAVVYFNPIWIFRHMAIICIISGKSLDTINLDLVVVAIKSFAINLPFSLPVNYLIQNKIPLKFRFLASALFSALMAIYYSISLVWLSL